jgi:hypothetical protein
VFTDSSFANNHDFTSQIGFVIVLADKHNKANIIHWSSIKCKGVTRSVLASKLYGMAHGFDIRATFKSTLEKILRIKTLSLFLCTDSKSLYDCLVKLRTTQEKRLIVDLMCLRQSYERQKITEIKWIDGDNNLLMPWRNRRYAKHYKTWLVRIQSIWRQLNKWKESKERARYS